MKLISISSSKGGVGKTTIAANLAHMLSLRGFTVLAIDFDSQNSLRTHFGIPLSDTQGFVSKALRQSDWSPFIISVSNNLFVLPYGECDESTQRIFEQRLLNDNDFLHHGLQALHNTEGLILVADTASLSSPAFKALTQLADIQLIPLLSDTASMTQLPYLERTGFLEHPQSVKNFFILNQTNPRSDVCQDVETFAQNTLSKQLIGQIHRDESVLKAHSAQQSISEFNRLSAAAADIAIISDKVIELLGLEIGTGAIYHDLKESIHE